MYCTCWEFGPPYTLMTRGYCFVSEKSGGKYRRTLTHFVHFYVKPNFLYWLCIKLNYFTLWTVFNNKKVAGITKDLIGREGVKLGRFRPLVGRPLKKNCAKQFFFYFSQLKEIFLVPAPWRQEPESRGFESFTMSMDTENDSPKKKYSTPLKSFFGY